MAPPPTPALSRISKNSLLRWTQSPSIGKVLFSFPNSNSISPNFASPPCLQTTSQVFLSGSEGDDDSPARVLGREGLTAWEEKGWRGQALEWGLGLERKDDLYANQRAASQADKFARYRAWLPAAEACLQVFPSLRFLPGWDFLFITEKRRPADLLSQSHRRVSLADQALCYSKDTMEDSRPLFLAFFVPARSRFARTPWPFGTTTHLRLFRFLFSQAPPPAPRDHDDRPAGLPVVEARGAAAGVRWVDFRFSWRSGEEGCFLLSRDTPPYKSRSYSCLGSGECECGFISLFLRGLFSLMALRTVSFIFDSINLTHPSRPSFTSASSMYSLILSQESDRYLAMSPLGPGTGHNRCVARP